MQGRGRGPRRAALDHEGRSFSGLLSASQAHQFAGTCQQQRGPGTRYRWQGLFQRDAFDVSDHASLRYASW
jgi:hypothetical protein